MTKPHWQVFANAVRDFVQDRMKNVIITCEIETNDFGREAELLAAVVNAEAYYNDRVYIVSRWTTWNIASDMNIENLAEELEYIVTSMSFALGEEIFTKKERE